MGYYIVNRSPAVEAETDIAYSKGAWCATSLATFITELGYKAIPTVNEIGINVPSVSGSAHETNQITSYINSFDSLLNET